jgi:septum formation protein
MIYLASQSPRRAELLRQIGVEYEVCAADLDEEPVAGESATEYVCRVACDKARVVYQRLAQTQKSLLVLAADTTITLEGDIIGKPRDRVDCCSILRRLSGRDHEVLSAVALASGAGLMHRLNRSRIRFRELSDEEIGAYCAGGEPMDKAGAYAIQGKAAVFIEWLEGSYSAVMGLPLFETAGLLRDAGIEIFDYDG